MILGKYNQSKTITFDLVAPDGVDLVVAATFAAGDIVIMKDEGAEANTTNLPTDEGTGYSLVLTAAELSAARIRIYIIDQTATKIWLDISLGIETYGHASAEHAFDLDTASTPQTADHAANITLILADTGELQTNQGNWLTATGFATPTNITAGTITTVTNLTNLPAIPANWLTAAGIAAGALNGKGDWNIGKTGYSLAQAFPANFADMTIEVATGKVNVKLTDTCTSNTDMRGTDNAALATALATAQLDLDTITAADGVILGAAAVDLILDELLSGHNVGGSLAKAIRQILEGTVSVESTVNDAAATTTSFITALTEATDNHYKDISIVFIDGALIGQSRPILGYNGTTKAITLDEALTDAPTDGDSFILKTDHVHPVSDIQAGLATEAKQDIIDANVDAIRVDTGTTIPATLSAQDAAIADLPTVAEFEARTPTAAELAYITRHAATALPVTFTGGTTTTAILGNVDGVAASSTDDVYNSRLLVFNAGTLNVQVCQITDYDGATKTATISAVTTAVTSGHTAVLV